MEVKKEVLTIRIPKELNEAFSEYALQRGMSKCAIILNLIYKEIQKNLPKKN